MFLAEGCEEIEAISVVDVLRRADITCNMCTINEEYVRGTHNIIIKSDCHIDSIDVKEYDAADNLKDKSVEEIVKRFNEEDKIVAAICVAPETLEGFGVLENKSCTSYPGFVKNRDKVNYIEDELVVVYNNIITSRGPATATLFALEILKELGETKKSEEIKEGMMVKFYNQVIK